MYIAFRYLLCIGLYTVQTTDPRGTLGLDSTSGASGLYSGIDNLAEKSTACREAGLISNIKKQILGFEEG